MNIDELNIQIKSDATRATSAISRLTDKILGLSGALKNTDTTSMARLSASLSAFSSAAMSLSNVKTADFTRLVKNLNSLDKINSSAIINTSNAIQQVAMSLTSLQGMDSVSADVANMVSAINKFGLKNTERAISNLPQLADSLNTVMKTLSNAPQVSQNTIQFINSLSSLANQGQKTGTAVKSLTNNLKEYNTTSEKSLSLSTRLAVAIGKFNLIYYTVRRVASAMWSLVEAASDTYESLNYFDVAMNKVAENAMDSWQTSVTTQMANAGYQSAEEYYDSFQERLGSLMEQLTGYDTSNNTLKLKEMASLGLNISDVMQHSAAFIQMADSIGMVGESSLNTSKALTMLAADWSSLKNIDLSTAMGKMESALAGQSRAVRSLGIDITQNYLQELAYQIGIEKSVTLMNQEEKSLLRVIAMLNQSEVAYGDLAKTIESPANQVRVLQAQMQNLSRTIGSIFLPAIQNIIPYITGFTVALNRMLTSLGEWLGVDWSQTVTSTKDYEIAYDELADSIDDTANAQKKLNSQLRAFDEINNISTTTSSANTSAEVSETEVLLNQTLADALEKYEKKWNDTFDNMETKAEKFAKAIQSAMGTLVNIFDWELIATSISKVWEAIKKFRTNTMEGFLTFIEKVTLPALSVALNTVSAALQLISEVILQMRPETLNAIGGALAGVLTVFVTYKLTSGIQSGIKNTFEITSYGLNSLVEIATKHPLLALAAGISAVVGAIIAVKEYKFAQEEKLQLELFGDTISNLAKKHEEARLEFDKKIESANIEYDNSISDLAELDLLWKKYKDIESSAGDAAEKELLLKEYAKRIIDIVPELGNAIDEETGHFSDQIDEIDALIEKQKELYRTKAAEDKVTLYMEAQVDLLIEKDRLENELEKTKQEMENEIIPWLNAITGEWQDSYFGTVYDPRTDAYTEMQKRSEEYNAYLTQLYADIASTDLAIAESESQIDNLLKLTSANFKINTEASVEAVKNMNKEFVGYGNSIRSTLDSLNTKAKKTPLEIANNLLLGNKDIESAGTELIKSFGNGISGAGSKYIQPKLAAITVDIKTLLDISEDTKTIGAEVGFSLIQGLDSAKEAVVSKAKELAGSAIAGLRSALGSTDLEVNVPDVATSAATSVVAEVVSTVASATSKSSTSTTDNGVDMSLANSLLKTIAENTSKSSDVYLDSQKITKKVADNMSNYYSVNGKSMVLE